MHERGTVAVLATTTGGGLVGLMHQEDGEHTADEVPEREIARPRRAVRRRPGRRTGMGERGTDILTYMRLYSLLFALISLVVLVMFLVYVVRGPVDPLIAGGLFVSFLACAAPALLLLKPFEPSEELKRRQEERRERARKRGFTDGPPKRGRGS